MSHPMITASLENFARTGTLGAIELGIHRSEVERLAGLPTDTIAGHTPVTAPLWWYGNAELHFDDSGLIWLIHFDTCFGIPEGGSGLLIVPWVLRSGLPLTDLEQALAVASVEYHVVPDEWNEGCVKVIAGCGVEFIAQVGGAPDELGLNCFGMSQV